MSFPSSPTNDQTYTNALGTLYKYDSTKTVWNILTQSGSGTASSNKTFSWVISSPLTGGIVGGKTYEAMTALRVSSYISDGSNVIFNIQTRPVAPGTAGNTLLVADQTASTSGVDAVSSALQNISIAADSWLFLDIKSQVGNPTKLTVTLAATT